MALREAQASSAESLADSERAELERRERRAAEAEETLRVRTEAFDAREREAEERVARLEAEADRREETFERTEADLAEREERLQRKEAELVRQRADLASTLLASLGHDLRTPLTAIKVAITNLEDPHLSGEQRDDRSDDTDVGPGIPLLSVQWNTPADW